jgi:hypothetical protein
LIPLLSIWTTSLGKAEAAELLSGFNSEHLQHCNKQFWLPGSETEALLYGGDTHHGIALNNIPITEDGAAALSILEAECSDEAASPFSQLSAISLGHWPILVMACRQYRLPLPPNLWLDLIRSHRESR